MCICYLWVVKPSRPRFAKKVFSIFVLNVSGITPAKQLYIIIAHYNTIIRRVRFEEKNDKTNKN
jgi:hypothetical protein